MQKLKEFEFGNRPSRGQFAHIVAALDEPDTVAVKLVRGEDFPEGVKMSSVQTAVRSEIVKTGKRAKTEVINDNEIVVAYNTDPAPARRKTKRREFAAA